MHISHFLDPTNGRYETHKAPGFRDAGPFYLGGHLPRELSWLQGRAISRRSTSAAEKFVALPLLSCLVALQQDDFGNRFSDWSYYSCSSLFKPLLLLLLLLPANFIASASPVLRLREGLERLGGFPPGSRAEPRADQQSTRTPSPNLPEKRNSDDQGKG